jgi:pre-mRNA-splicing factor CDC5/CEF1
MFFIKASKILEEEIPLIKKAMGHGELTNDVYAQVWEECYNQVLYVPTSNRFTRASVTSRKDKIESYEKKLQTNREIMIKEAKAASKLEQKLKIVLGGYQVSIKIINNSKLDYIYMIYLFFQVEKSSFDKIAA